ncbi:MAG TPA: hypothetical protein VK629_04880 [Steroidobacteraceae bacterium]|nr:hypothetical protein [Steroidobacteraceae bacterium]
MNSLDKLAAAWKLQNLKLLPAESRERVIAVFDGLGVQPSEQLIRLYTTIGGFEIADENDWTLWSLDRVEEESRDERSTDGILFSDYLVSCWCFRLKLAAHGEMEVLRDAFDSNHPCHVVAKDLETFFTAMIEDPDSALGNRRS